MFCMEPPCFVLFLEDSKLFYNVSTKLKYKKKKKKRGSPKRWHIQSDLSEQIPLVRIPAL